MPICPNCGSWVDDGDVCMNCGGGVGYGSSDYYDPPPSYGHSTPRYETPEEREERYRRAEERRKEIQEKREEEKRQKEEEKRQKELEEEKKRKSQQAHLKFSSLQHEAEERKRKEECKRNPECLKEEIESSKNKILGVYSMLLRFEDFQKKTDSKFSKIVLYEGLLEKMGVKENFTKKEIRELKKQNKRYRNILSRVGAKYRSNGSVLYMNNQRRIGEFERIHPEKGLVRGLFNEVFKSDEFNAFDAEIVVRDKIQRARNLVSDNSDNICVNLHEARTLMNNAKDELSGYLKHYSFPDLEEMKTEIINLQIWLKSKIRGQINANKWALFLMNLGDNQFKGFPGMELELVNEGNGEAVKVFYENNLVGDVSSRFIGDFENPHCDAPELRYLPKVSAAEYFFKYEDFDIIKIDLRIAKKEKARLRLEKSKALRKYPLSELITIIDTTGNSEFEEGLKFKIVKESVNIRAADAFGVYRDDEKLGIVANRLTSKCGLTSMASNIKYIPDVCYAEYLMEYDNYHIARIIYGKW